MADYQAIAQGLRAALRPEARVSQEELADLAAGFATICRETNTRLERCLDYASNGLSSEVAHLASCQPSLERLISAFQAIDVGRWVELCVNVGVPSGPPLLIEAWPKVKAVLDSERAVRPLLARYRTLAIAKSPIVDRLKIARALASHDSIGTAWVDQVRMLEELRLAEIAEQLRTCAEGPESAAFKALVREVTAEKWLSPLPDELMIVLQPILDAEKAAAACKELGMLAAWFDGDAADQAGLEKVDETINRWRALADSFSAAGLTRERVEQIEARFTQLKRRLGDQRAEDQRRLVTSMFHPPSPTAAVERPTRSRVRLTLVIVLVGLIGTLVFAVITKPPLLERWLGKGWSENR